MASRVAQKQALRERRLAEDVARQAESRRRTRARLLIGALVVAALLVVGLVALSQSQSGGGGDASNIEGASAVERLMGSLPQDGFVLGDPSAPVTIHEYGDLQCPACKAFADSELPTVIEKQVETGAAKLEFHNYVILGPDSETAAKGAVAAARQDRHWQFAHLFYANQGIENSGYVTDEFLEGVAQAAGLDLARWKRDMEASSVDRELLRVQQEASRFGLDGTPSFRVEGRDGRAVTPEGNTADSIAAAVEQVR